MLMVQTVRLDVLRVLFTVTIPGNINWHVGFDELDFIVKLSKYS